MKVHRQNWIKVLFIAGVLSLLCSACVSGVRNNEDGHYGQVLKIEQNPAAGFYWDYYLYVPVYPASEANSTTSRRLLVAPNNSGTSSDDMALHAERALQLLRRVQRWFGTELGGPILVPVFSRPGTIPDAPREGWRYYTHALDRQSLELESAKYRRIDEQLQAMILHAQSLLTERGIAVEKRVFMFGFSASGNYTNRFVFLHPEIVQAAAAGGLNGMPLLPLSEMQGRRLYYPVGIYDVEQLSGEAVDMDTVRRTPQYLFMGALDSNDTLPYDDAFDQREREIIIDVFDTEPLTQQDESKAHILIERFELSEALYQQARVPAEFTVYEGIGHTLNERVQQDIIEFFRNSSEGGQNSK